MQRIITTLAIAGLAIAGAAMAEDTLPLRAVNQANEIIDATIEAYGGADRLSGIRTLETEANFQTWLVDQSRGTEPPWDRGEQSNHNAIDFEEEFFFTRAAGSGGGFDFDTTTIIDGEDSWTLNHRAGTASPIEEPDYDTTSGPFIRVTAPLLVKQLMERRHTAHWLGEVKHAGRPHDVVTMVMEVGPALAMYIDRESRLLTRMERVLPPFGQVDYRFLDYETIEGIPFATRFELYVNDDQQLAIDYDRITLNEPVQQLAQVPDSLERIEPIPTDEFALHEIQEGVFLVGGNGTYSMFVEMPDHVVAVGGTNGVANRIKALREVIPDKPIRYAVLTHHHSDHVPGAADYAAEGATLVTHAAHADIVREAAGTDDVRIVAVDDRYELNGGDRSIVIHDMGPTPHSEHLLAAWLPDEKILFEADHFSIPNAGPVPPAQDSTVAFFQRVDQLGLDYRALLSAHSPRVATPEHVADALRQRAGLRTASASP